MSKKQIKLEEFISKINKLVPLANAVPASEFYGHEAQGVWIRGSEEYCEEYQTCLFDYYKDYDNQLHPIIARLCKRFGYYLEPYDAGTAMLQPE